MEEENANPIAPVSVALANEKSKYLARPGVATLGPDIESRLSRLSEEQQAEVLHLANASGLTLADLQAHIALVYFVNEAYNGASKAMGFAAREVVNDLGAFEKRQQSAFSLSLKRMADTQAQLTASLTAILKRTDEALELIDSKANEAVESVHKRADSAAIAREAVELAQKEATRAFFKEAGGALKGYVKKEIEAQIHAKTSRLNMLWFCIVVVCSPLSFWLGKVVH